jgi:hypothetical protein
MIRVPEGESTTAALTSSSQRYDIGVDPGARNTAVACSDDRVFLPCVLDLGPLNSTTDQQIVDTLVSSLWPLFSDENLERVIVEAQPASLWAEKPPKISARNFLVQGALQTLAFAWNKRFVLVSPLAWKRHYNNGIWEKKTYEENKAWSVKKATELFGPEYAKRIHHACEAKLLATFAKDV